TIFEIKLNGADFFFFSKHVLSPESPGNRPHPQRGHYSLVLTHHSPSIAFRRLSGYYNVVEALQ
ncbi:TPA: hypothetical protein ACJFM5_004904, partial [Escherichia coli]